VPFEKTERCLKEKQIHIYILRQQDEKKLNKNLWGAF